MISTKYFLQYKTFTLLKKDENVTGKETSHCFHTVQIPHYLAPSENYKA